MIGHFPNTIYSGVFGHFSMDCDGKRLGFDTEITWYQDQH
jgi:hypothetical protein